MKYCPQCKMARKYEVLKLNLDEGIPAWKVGEMAGVHENTIYNWKETFEQGGILALADQSRAPKTHPNEYSNELKDLIRKIRRTGLEKEKRHLGEKVIAHRIKRDHGME